MRGVLAKPPCQPTSLQPRSSATISRMLGGAGREVSSPSTRPPAAGSLRASGRRTPKRILIASFNPGVLREGAGFFAPDPRNAGGEALVRRLLRRGRARPVAPAGRPGGGGDPPRAAPGSPPAAGTRRASVPPDPGPLGRRRRVP